MMMPDQSLAQLTEKAAKAAGLLKSLSNEKRLLILCHLISEGELTVGNLEVAWRICTAA
jgi:ArsR family transcriptional regulator, virulence genes transcriptional regulator